MRTIPFLYILAVCLLLILTGNQVSANDKTHSDVSTSQLDLDMPSIFLMNRGAIFSENEEISESLHDSVEELITAIHNGDITDRLVAREDRERYSFFMKALRHLEMRSDVQAEPPMVLKSFSPDGDTSFLITIAFKGQGENSDQIEKVIEFHAYPDKERFSFKSPFEYRTRAFSTTTLDDVQYYYSGSINHERTQQFVSFKNQLESDLDTTKRPLQYYCFETLDELLRAYGIVYDCTRCNWLKEDLGFMDDNGRAFLTGTGNENFIFDYLVDYMSQYCDQDGNLYPPFIYGMAAYFGGYGLSGDDLQMLKAQFREELKHNPEINFLHEYRKGRKSSIQRHFTHYVIGAFICEEVLDHHGFDGVMKLARSGRDGEQFYSTLETLLGVNESDFHQMVVRQIRLE